MGDFFYNITEWLGTTFLVDVAIWASETSLSLWIVTTFWAIPILQVAHILSIAVAFGAALMMSLRILELAGGGWTVPEAGKRYFPWLWWGLVGIVVSGGLMLFGDTYRNLINSVFWLKMIGVVVVVVLTAIFQKSVVTKATIHGSPEWRASGGTRAMSVVLLVLWCLVMAGGRWIAYAPA